MTIRAKRITILTVEGFQIFDLPIENYVQYYNECKNFRARPNFYY